MHGLGWSRGKKVFFIFRTEKPRGRIFLGNRRIGLWAKGSGRVCFIELNCGHLFEGLHGLGWGNPGYAELIITGTLNCKL